MKNRLNFIFNEAIIIDILVGLLGLFLLCNPLLVTSVANVLLAIFLIISGMSFISKYIINMEKSRYFTYQLLFGLLSCVFGIIFLINPLLLSNVITLVVGFWILISGFIKLSLVIKFKKYNEESWVINGVISVLTIVVGVLLLINPFKSFIVLSTYIGIMITIYSAMDIVEMFILKKRVKEIGNILKK